MHRIVLLIGLAFTCGGLACREALIEPSAIHTYTVRENSGEIADLPRGAGYAVEKHYRRSWSAEEPSIAEEALPFLRLVPLEQLEIEITTDIDRYCESLRGRKGFSRKLLSKILEFEKIAAPTRQIYYRQSDKNQRRTADFARLLDGSTWEDGSRHILELEHFEGLSVEERADPSIGVVELGRRYHWWNTTGSTSFDDNLLVEVATYLDLRYVSRGRSAVVYVHADKAGAEGLFPRYGFRVVKRPEELTLGNHYWLRQTAEELLQRYPSRLPVWKALWERRHPTQAVYELFAAPRVEGDLMHPFLRPTIAMSPKLIHVARNRNTQGELQQDRMPLSQWQQHWLRSIDLAF